MPNRKRKALHRQSVFSVRITNDVDDGFLKWINDLHDEGVLQRTAFEGLYMVYSKQLEIPGRWVHTPNPSTATLHREILGLMSLSETDQSTRNPSPEAVAPTLVAPQSDQQSKAEETSEYVNQDALNAALRFLEDD